MAAKNADLADKTTQQITGSVKAAEAIPAPFDRALVGAKDAPGRVSIEKTIASLIAQSGDIVAAASAVGINKLNLAKP